jgi:hypothetical protein
MLEHRFILTRQFDLLHVFFAKAIPALTYALLQLVFVYFALSLFLVGVVPCVNDTVALPEGILW